ncbi:MAG: hypothetical protein DMF97_06845 [Acidobacteria bacterium]|nr:MAG: hypothetical protein DMF97_06845 [Acidobacteriota bacterium]
MKLPTLPLRVRLTLFYTVVLVVVLCAVGVDVWWVEWRLGLRRLDRELEGLSSTVTNVMREELAEGVSVEGAAQEASHTVSIPDRAIAILDNSGRPIAANWNGLPWSSRVLPERDFDVWTLTTGAGRWRVRADPRRYGDTSVWHVVASSLRDVEREQHEVVETISLALFIVFLLAGGGGLWIAKLALRPITEMARQATHITTTGSETLAADARRDELGAFATAFNGLLTRLRDALRTQRQFMADA